MTLTRANVEVVLTRRAGALLAEAGLDGTTANGTNLDLNDPLGWAVRQAGGTVADFTAVADADVATVASADYDQLLDLAEYRTLENIAGNLADFDITVGPRTERRSQLVAAIEKRLERKRKQLKDDYGFSTATLETGLITYEFVEHQ